MEVYELLFQRKENIRWLKRGLIFNNETDGKMKKREILKVKDANYSVDEYSDGWIKMENNENKNELVITAKILDRN